jgi:hypothetical protein
MVQKVLVSDVMWPKKQFSAIDERDVRLYVSQPDGIEACVKSGWEKEYCHLQNPGEAYFHLLVKGEIYLLHGNEKCCLRCALRQGILTHERLSWQHPAQA